MATFVCDLEDAKKFFFSKKVLSEFLESINVSSIDDNSRDFNPTGYVLVPNDFKPLSAPDVMSEYCDFIKNNCCGLVNSPPDLTAEYPEPNPRVERKHIPTDARKIARILKLIEDYTKISSRYVYCPSDESEIEDDSTEKHEENGSINQTSTEETPIRPKVKERSRRGAEKNLSMGQQISEAQLSGDNRTSGFEENCRQTGSLLNHLIDGSSSEQAKVSRTSQADKNSVSSLKTEPQSTCKAAIEGISTNRNSASSRIEAGSAIGDDIEEPSTSYTKHDILELKKQQDKSRRRGKKSKGISKNRMWKNPLVNIFNEHIVNTVKIPQSEINPKCLLRSIKDLVKIKQEFDKILDLEDFIGPVDGEGIWIHPKVKFEFDAFNFNKELEKADPDAFVEVHYVPYKPEPLVWNEDEENNNPNQAKCGKTSTKHKRRSKRNDTAHRRGNNKSRNRRNKENKDNKELNEGNLKTGDRRRKNCEPNPKKEASDQFKNTRVFVNSRKKELPPTENQEQGLQRKKYSEIVSGSRNVENKTDINHNTVKQGPSGKLNPKEGTNRRGRIKKTPEISK